MNQQIRELALAEFPPLLREIPDQPKRLRMRGVLPSSTTRLLCVVGARRYTEYGRAAAERLIEGLRGIDVAVVSGLALGIDSIAHRAALRAGLRTIAVPGSGLGRNALYPRSHVGLADEIVANGGALLSEFDDDFRAAPWAFPKRNRIMAGMSHATLIVEAEIRSGSLITSRLAADYSRDVLAVPGSIFSRASEGPNMLLTIGATPIRTSDDILRALGIEAAQAAVPADLSQLTLNEQKVAELLGVPMQRDELIVRLGIGASEANILLMEMELKGLIVESLGEVRLA